MSADDELKEFIKKNMESDYEYVPLPYSFHVSDLGQVYLLYENGVIIECEQERGADGSKLHPIAVMQLPTNKEIRKLWNHTQKEGH